MSKSLHSVIKEALEGQAKPEFKPTPNSLNEAALNALCENQTIEEGPFDTLKALGKNVAGKVANKVSAGVQAIKGELEKAKSEGDAAEVARLQARIAQLQKNQPATKPVATEPAATPTASGTASKAIPAPKDPVEYVATLKKDIPEIPDDRLLKMAANNKQMLSNPDGPVQKQNLPLWKAAEPILAAEIKKRGLKVPGAVSSKPAASGAAALAQKTAQSKLTKQSTKQLQATLANIQALLKQRGVTEEAMGNEEQ